MFITYGIRRVVISYNAQKQEEILSKPHETGVIVASFEGFYIDETGYITSQKPLYTVPDIYATTRPISEGDVISDGSFHMLIAFLKASIESKLAVESATIYNDDYIEIVLSNEVTVLASSDTDPYLFRTTLPSIIDAYVKEKRALDFVDLRFDKPYIKERYGA